MADYVIGDVQGCYDPLLRLLDAIDFDEKRDRVWFAGDLVNRGPQSLAVLRFVKKIAPSPCVTLGNHDLHLLANMFGSRTNSRPDDTLEAVLQAPDRDELGDWLRHQPILYHHRASNTVLCHAGIAPCWSLEEASLRAHELEAALRGEGCITFLDNLYGNEPDHWSDTLTGVARLRVICNYFTRMRFCDATGRLVLNYKGNVANAPQGLYPWYEVPNRVALAPEIVFGHWAALKGVTPHTKLHAIDTGCIWGGQLTALRLQDKQRFSVTGIANPHQDVE